MPDVITSEKTYSVGGIPVVTIKKSSPEQYEGQKERVEGGTSTRVDSKHGDTVGKYNKDPVNVSNILGEAESRGIISRDGSTYTYKTGINKDVKTNIDKQISASGYSVKSEGDSFKVVDHNTSIPKTGAGSPLPAPSVKSTNQSNLNVPYQQGNISEDQILKSQVGVMTPSGKGVKRVVTKGSTPPFGKVSKEEVYYSTVPYTDKKISEQDAARANIDAVRTVTGHKAPVSPPAPEKRGDWVGFQNIAYDVTNAGELIVASIVPGYKPGKLETSSKITAAYEQANKAPKDRLNQQELESLAYGIKQDFTKSNKEALTDTKLIQGFSKVKTGLDEGKPLIVQDDQGRFGSPLVVSAVETTLPFTKQAKIGSYKSETFGGDVFETYLGDTLGKDTAKGLGETVGRGFYSVTGQGYLAADTYITVQGAKYFYGAGKSGITAVATKGFTSGGSAILKEAGIQTIKTLGSPTRLVTGLVSNKILSEGAKASIQYSFGVAQAGAFAYGQVVDDKSDFSEYGKGIGDTAGKYFRYQTLQSKGGEREEVVGSMVVGNAPYVGGQFLNVRPTGAISKGLELGYKGANFAATSLIVAKNIQEAESEGFGVSRGLGRATSELGIIEYFQESITIDELTGRGLRGLKGKDYDKLIRSGQLKTSEYKDYWSAVEGFSVTPTVKPDVKADYKPSVRSDLGKFDIRGGFTIKPDVRLTPTMTTTQKMDVPKLDYRSLTPKPDLKFDNTIKFDDTMTFDFTPTTRQDTTIRQDVKTDVTITNKFGSKLGGGIPFFPFSNGSGGASGRGRKAKKVKGSVYDLLTITRRGGRRPLI